jgi:hypothetical protein
MGKYFVLSMDDSVDGEVDSLGWLYVPPVAAVPAKPATRGAAAVPGVPAQPGVRIPPGHFCHEAVADECFPIVDPPTPPPAAMPAPGPTLTASTPAAPLPSATPAPSLSTPGSPPYAPLPVH